MVEIKNARKEQSPDIARLIMTAETLGDVMIVRE